MTQTSHSGTSARSRARRLYEARLTRKPIPPFTGEDPSLGLADGYAIQQELVAMLLADGEQVAGYKAGLTSEPMQQMFGVTTPDYGPVLASTVFSDNATLQTETFIEPKVEAEIVFRLASGLQGPGVTVEQARGSIGEVMAGLEIVDSRIEDWRIGLADTVADLASAGAIVLGAPVAPAADLDARLIGCVFSRNGNMIATGAGAAALGDPVAVVAWLANQLGDHGISMEAGQLIFTGALHAAVPFLPGDEFVAEFDRLGSISVRGAQRA